MNLKNNTIKYTFKVFIFCFLLFNLDAKSNKEDINLSHKKVLKELMDIAVNLNDSFVDSIEYKEMAQRTFKNLFKNIIDKDFNYSNIVTIDNIKDKNSFSKELQKALKYLENKKKDMFEIFKWSAKSLLASLNEKYSFYYASDELEDINDTVTGNFGGVGMVISPNITDYKDDKAIYDYIKIVKITEDGSAKDTDLEAGDLIIEIDKTDVFKKTNEEVGDLLRGPINSKVEIKVKKTNGKEKTYILKRKNIEVPNLEYAYIKDTDTLYINILKFTPQSPENFKEALKNTRRNNGYSSIVIDLRTNAGGVFTSALILSDFFLKGGDIIKIMSKDSTNTKQANNRIFINDDIPVIILVGPQTASASEIFSGALKDRQRAYLIGSKTYGKGKVQRVSPIEGGILGMYKYTISRYFTPANKVIDGIGIEPDIKIVYPKNENITYNQFFKLNYFLLDKFLDKNPEPNKEDILNLQNFLKKDDIKISLFYLNSLISQKLSDRINLIYDKNDPTLKEALSLIEKELVFDYIKQANKNQKQLTLKAEEILNL